MIIVKTVEFRNRLKELLEKIYNGEEDGIFLDYYGKVFEIKPVNKASKTKKTKTQKLIEHFQNRERLDFANDPIFNEADPAQEKANFRELMVKRYYEKRNYDK
jgi:hypothetical protein